MDGGGRRVQPDQRHLDAQTRSGDTVRRPVGRPRDEWQHLRIRRQRPLPHLRPEHGFLDAVRQRPDSGERPFGRCHTQRKCLRDRRESGLCSGRCDPAVQSELEHLHGARGDADAPALLIFRHGEQWENRRIGRRLRQLRELRGNGAGVRSVNEYVGESDAHADGAGRAGGGRDAQREDLRDRRRQSRRVPGDRRDGQNYAVVPGSVWPVRRAHRMGAQPPMDEHF